MTVKITVGSMTVAKQVWLSFIVFSSSSASFGVQDGLMTYIQLSGPVTSGISDG
jgi:hypothetical protein